MECGGCECSEEEHEWVGMSCDGSSVVGMWWCDLLCCSSIICNECCVEEDFCLCEDCAKDYAFYEEF